MLVSIDEYTQYSPFLTSCSSFHGTNTVEVDCRPELLQNYLSFLCGQDFQLTPEDAEFFDYMGHPNESAYPLDYWKLKLRSSWIRDNFHRLDLGSNPLYGLIKVPIRRHLDLGLELDSSHSMIAEGAALYMTGVTNSLKGIKVFSINKRQSIKAFRKYCGVQVKRRGKYQVVIGIDKLDTATIFNVTVGSLTTHNSGKITLIPTVYSCPSEIAHSFDIDCAQFVLVDNELYGTELAIYTINHRCQYPDVSKLSTPYLQQLAKYHQKGIRLKLPLIGHDDLKVDYHADLTSWIGGGFDLEVDTSRAAILIYLSMYDVVNTDLINILMNEEPLPENERWNRYQLPEKKYYPSLFQLYKECQILSPELKASLP